MRLAPSNFLGKHAIALQLLIETLCIIDSPLSINHKVHYVTSHRMRWYDAPPPAGAVCLCFSPEAKDTWRSVFPVTVVSDIDNSTLCSTDNGHTHTHTERERERERGVCVCVSLKLRSSQPSLSWSSLLTDMWLNRLMNKKVLN